MLSLLLQVCGCGSVLELLIGRLPVGHTPTSPYLRAVYSSDIPDTGVLDSPTRTEVPDHDSRIVRDTGRADAVFSESSGGLEQRVTKLIPDPDAVLEQESTSSCQSSATGRSVESSRLVDTHPMCHPTDRLEGDVGAHPTSELEKDLEDERNGEEKEELLEFRGGLLKPILSILRRKLTRETWKTHPTAKHALVWCLKHLQVCVWIVPFPDRLWIVPFPDCR